MTARILHFPMGHDAIAAEFQDGYDAAIACDRLEGMLCHLSETSDVGLDPRIAGIEATLDRLAAVMDVQTSEWHAAFWSYFQKRGVAP